MIKFQFTWFKKERNPIERKNVITVTRNITDIEKAAESAKNTFISSFGSLKRNEIVSIYPLNKDGEPFGEAITLTKSEK